MSHLKLAIIAAAISSSIMPTAFAQEPVTRSVEVNLQGLDLSNPADMSVAEKRIRGAAKDVCTDSSGAMTLEQRRNFRNCYDTALEGAFERLGPVTGDAFVEKENLQG